MPKCPKDCKKHNPFIFRKVVIPAVIDDDTINPPANGAYCNAVVVYEATGNVYLYSSDGIPTSLSSTDYNLLSNLPSINGKVLRGDVTLSDLGISQLIDEEAELRATADEILQHQIDAITAASDVVDIVGTYEELEEYDTSKLKENDIVKVLSDETIGGATAYYRWVNGAWQYIGQEGPYYTKSQTDALLDQKMDITSLDSYYTKTETDTLLAAKASVSDLANKQDKLIAGSNITIDPTTNVISATVPSLTNYYTKSETYNQTEVDNLISGVRADIPTKTSDLLNDSGFLTSIPIASSSVLGGIKVGSGLSIAQDGTLSATGTSITVDSALSTTSTNPVENRVITNALNGKANTSDIPTVPTNVSSFYNDAGYLTSTDVASNYYNKSETYTQAQVNALIPTKTSNLVNDGSDGTSTYVEADDLATVATSGSYNDLTDKPSVMTGLVEMSYGESNAWAKFIAAYQAKQIVYCRASSNSNPASGSQTRKAFMAYVNNADNPTEVEFQYVRSVSSKTSSQPVDQVFVYKLTSASGGTWTVQTRDMAPKLANGTNTTVSYSNGTYKVNATQPTVNNATLTIQKNGTNVQTFTANQSTNATANITVPTKTSDITNDSDFVSDASYVHTDNNYTTADKDKLAGIAAGAEVNVQANWNEADSSSDAYIQNKPTIGNATLTVQKNGTTLDTFTANATANKTINISVPTKTSDLTNDSGYVVDDGDITCKDTDGGFAQITNPTSHNVAPTSLTHLYGNATQETLSGKNLLHVVDQGTYTINGITSSSSNQTIKLTGTNTASANFGAWSSPSSGYPSLQPNTTYTISAETNWTSTGIYIQLNYLKTGGGAGGALVTLTPNAQPKVTFTVPSDFESVNSFFVGVRTTVTTINNAEFRVQIEAGSTATAYEPYVGGSPMPNPQFPSPVETVTGAQTVKITGKNIINQVETNKTVSSIGTIGAGNTNYLGIESAIPCRPSTTYSVSLEHDEPMANIYVGYWDANGDFISRTGYGTDRTFTTPNNAHSFFFYLNKTGITFPTVGGWLQVELSNSPTAYEPYQGQSQEINLGKNLLPTTDGTSTSYGMAYTISSGTISASGTTTATSVCDLTATYPISLKAGQTYTLSINNPVGGPSVAVRLMDRNNTPLAGSTVNANTGANASISFTPSTDVAELKGQIRVASGVTLSNFIIKPMLEVGSQATSYAPYKTPIELAKIGTYQDYIWNDDGTWKIHKEIGKVVFNGSEAWGNVYLNTAGLGTTNLTLGSEVAQGNSAGFSDHFTYKWSYNSSTPCFYVYNENGNGKIMCIQSLTTKQDWLDWLSTHNTTVYYALATPTDTEITDSGLIEQLNHIYELYQGVNNLFLIPSAGAQGEMTLCASLSQLPVATTRRLGAVMVGDGLTIAENGELSISNETYNRFVPKDDLWKITYPLLPTKSKIEISGDSLYYISGDDGMQAGWGFKSASDFALNEGMRCTVRTNGPASSSDAHYNSDMGLAIHTSYGTYVTKPIYRKFPYGSWSPAPTLKYSDIPNATNAYTLLDLVYVKNSYYDGWVVTNL